MRLGAILPFTGPVGEPLTGASLAEGARRLEQLGFDGVWVFDALGRGFGLPDPLIAVSIAATVTERVEVGTCILQVPLRRPVELAHRIQTAHLVCGDRLSLGVGAGSTEADFDAVGVPFAERHRRFSQDLPRIRRLVTGEEVDGVQLAPWPATAGGPPILIGSWAGSTWVPRAGRDYDGWIASAAKTSSTILTDGINRFREAGGSRALVTNIAVDLTATGRDLGPDDPFDLRCPPDQARQRLAVLANLGFDDAVVVVGDHTEPNLAAIRALL